MCDKDVRDPLPFRLWNECGESEIIEEERPRIDGDFFIAGLDDKGVKTTMVADVHTDTNSAQVLEEAVGYIHVALVVFSKDDALWFAGGPVLSYYEFKHPMNDRLTDESWMEMLEQGNTPSQPPWTTVFYAE